MLHAASRFNDHMLCSFHPCHFGAFADACPQAVLIASAYLAVVCLSTCLFDRSLARSVFF